MSRTAIETSVGDMGDRNLPCGLDPGLGRSRPADPSGELISVDAWDIGASSEEGPTGRPGDPPGYLGNPICGGVPAAIRGRVGEPMFTFDSWGRRPSGTVGRFREGLGARLKRRWREIPLARNQGRRLFRQPGDIRLVS